MAHILGNDLIVATVVNNVAYAIASAKSCDIDFSCDLKEISSPTSSEYRSYMAGRKIWRVTVNFMVPTDHTAVISEKNVGSTYTLRCYIRGNPDIDKIEGTAILQQAKVTGTRGNILQGSWVFQGSGDV